MCVGVHACVNVCASVCVNVRVCVYVYALAVKPLIGALKSDAPGVK